MQGVQFQSLIKEIRFPEGLGKKKKNALEPTTGKVSVYKEGDPGSISGWGRSPGEGNGNPLQYSCLENPMDGALGYSPWGRKESDTTE